MSWAPCAFNGKLYAQRFQWPINVWWPQRFLWLINAWWSNNQRPLMKHSIHLHWPIKPNFFFRITLFILLILPMILFPDHVSNSINIIYWPLFLLWTLIWPHFSTGSYHNLYASLTLDPTVLTRQTLKESRPKPNPRSAFCVHSRSTLSLLGGPRLDPEQTESWCRADPERIQSRPRFRFWGFPWCKVVAGQYCYSINCYNNHVSLTPWPHSYHEPLNSFCSSTHWINSFWTSLAINALPWPNVTC